METALPSLHLGGVRGRLVLAAPAAPPLFCWLAGVYTRQGEGVHRGSIRPSGAGAQGFATRVAFLCVLQKPHTAECGTGALAEAQRQALKDYARQLRAEGWGPCAIARELGVPQQTISRWVNEEPVLAPTAGNTASLTHDGCYEPGAFTVVNSPVEGFQPPEGVAPFMPTTG